MNRRFVAAGGRRGVRGSERASNVIPDAPDLIFLTDLVCWYRADTVTEAGTGIDQATDKGANADHLVQATDGNRPSLATGGSGSQPYMAFTAANSDRLRKTTGVAGFASSASYYMWLLASFGTAGRAYFSALVSGGSLADASLMIYRDGSGNANFIQTLGGGVGRVILAGSATGAGVALVEGWFDVADNKLRVSVDRGAASASAAQSNATLAGTVAEIILGGSVVDGLYATADVYDCGIAKTYSAAQQTRLRDYILARYAE